MSEQSTRLDRRNLLRGAGVAGAAVAVGASRAMAQTRPDPAITEIQDWNRYLGPGVEAAPYGKPVPFEKNVIRRNVPWLTAGTESSINFTPIHELDGVITPNGVAFERHHSGVAEIDPAQHRLMIHGLVDRPLVFTMDELSDFPAA